MVRRYVRAERERRGWSQGDLARAAGGISRTTVADLESGRRLREGKEAAIEAALGWPLGTLDSIRAGGAPPAATDEPEQPQIDDATYEMLRVIRLRLGREAFLEAVELLEAAQKQADDERGAS